MNVYVSTTYVNDASIEVKELVNVKDAKVRKFEADVMVPVGPGMAFPIHVEFPAEYSLEDCFTNFNDCVKMEIEKKMQEEKDKNLIIPASGMPPADVPDFKKNQGGFKLV